MNNIFKGLIRCTNCGKNYKFKMLRKQPSYICSGYANYSKTFCNKNITIKEEDLIHVIAQHFEIERINNYISEKVKAEDIPKLISLVDKIEAGEWGYKIYYKSGKQSIINITNDYGIKIQY